MCVFGFERVRAVIWQQQQELAVCPRPSVSNLFFALHIAMVFRVSGFKVLFLSPAISQVTPACCRGFWEEGMTLCVYSFLLGLTIILHEPRVHPRTYTSVV